MCGAAGQKEYRTRLTDIRGELQELRDLQTNEPTNFIERLEQELAELQR